MRVILKGIFKKEDVKIRTGFVWIRVGSSGGFCEHGNEHSGSVQEGNFLIS
jgi:hypothetical protein